MKMNKSLFYTLSFTWGIIMTVIGLCAAFGLVVTGHKAKKYGWCWYFETGNGWGGVNLGIVFITSKGASEHTKKHEHGHAIQNCIWGVLFPFVIAIPSATRYQDRKKRQAQGEELEPYDSVWYEGDASRRGYALIEEIGNGDN